jgi:uncharacterized membrane protein
MDASAVKSKLAQNLPFLLVVVGVIGIICSFIITLDKFKLLQNPSYSPICNLNPVISCGSVMASKHGSVFGFPNPFIGLAAFGVVLCVGMAILAGGQFKRWFWLGLQIGTVFGIGFVHWLFFESVYRIHALCPFCMVVWVITITVFWYVLLYNLEQGHLRIPSRAGPKITYFIRKHHLDILITWFLIIAILIFHHFWYFFGRSF